MSEYATIDFHGNVWRVTTPAGRMSATTGAAADLTRAFINAAYAAGRASAESAWHPASEPPDSDRAVLIFDGHEHQDVGCYDTNRRMWIHDDDDIAHVTHWRELPEPPESDK